MFTTRKTVAAIVAKFTSVIDELTKVQEEQYALADQKAKEAAELNAVSAEAHAEAVRAGKVAAKFRELLEAQKD